MERGQGRKLSAPGTDAARVAEARSLLAELVDIPSPSGSEGRIVDRIEEICLDWGLAPWRVATETGRDCLVVGPSDPALAIAAHVDTIDPPWPARSTIDGDIVRGLGSVDDKGGVVACLLAARDLAGDGPGLDELGVALAFPVDEERGGSGSRALALELRPDYAIALEATGLDTGVAEIGDVEGIVHVYGRSAHGALSDVGENAIDSAISLIGELGSLGLEQHEHPLLGRSHHEVDSIAAGSAFNTIPDRCSFKLSIRVMPGQGSGRVVADLERLVGSRGGRVELIEVTEPFESPEGSRLVAGLDAETQAVSGRPSKPIGIPAWTDAHNFVVFGGADAVVFGPGDFETAHTPDEHVDAAEVAKCAAIFTRLAERGWRG